MQLIYIEMGVYFARAGSIVKGPIDCISIVSRYLWVGNMTHFLHDIINFSLKKFAFHIIILLAERYACRTFGLLSDMV